jgi:bacterioferritin-associated ferredoxin
VIGKAAPRATCHPFMPKAQTDIAVRGPLDYRLSDGQRAAHVSVNQESLLIICQCAVVSDQLVTDAVASGARTLAHVCRATNAGRDCGSCVHTVRRVIFEHRERGAELVSDGVRA